MFRLEHRFAEPQLKALKNRSRCGLGSSWWTMNQTCSS